METTSLRVFLQPEKCLKLDWIRASDIVAQEDLRLSLLRSLVINRGKLSFMRPAFSVTRILLVDFTTGVATKHAHTSSI